MTYTWDDRGDLVNDGTFTYAYTSTVLSTGNSAGQLVRAESLAATLVYTYNAAGLRVAQSMDGAATTFAWDWATPSAGSGQAPVPELLRQGETRYLVGHDTLGWHDGKGHALSEVEGWTYSLPDALGSVRQIAGESGAITLARAYKPFGGILEEQGLYATAFGFLSAQLDRISGLLYSGGRYYDPATRRFLTPDRAFDPYNPRTLNPYAPFQDPALWLLAPLAVIATFKGGKKRRKYGYWLLLLLMLGVGTSVILTSCGPPTSTPPPPPPPTQPPTLPPTQPPPTPVPTPTPTPRPRTQWEIEYGKAIANAAHDLLNNADSYYIWGAGSHPPGEDEHYPPPREKPQPGAEWGGTCIDLCERTGGRTSIVCADVVALSYEGGGLSLYTFTDWAVWGTEDAPWQNDPTRDVWALKVLLENHQQKHQWGDGTLTELGDMVLSEGYGHSAVVAEITGDNPSQIFVIQASYSNAAIEKWSLADWQGSSKSHFGHPDPNRR